MSRVNEQVELDRGRIVWELIIKMSGLCSINVVNKRS